MSALHSRLHSRAFKAHPASLLDRIVAYAAPAAGVLRLHVTDRLGGDAEPTDFDLRSAHLRYDLRVLFDTFEPAEDDQVLNANVADAIVEWLRVEQIL